jgi:hypothetical protein
MILARAADIARTIDREVGERPASRARFIDSAFAGVLGRAPTDAERAECFSGLARLAAALQNEGPTASTPEGRARSALVHVLLNHNDFVTIR